MLGLIVIGFVALGVGFGAVAAAFLPGRDRPARGAVLRREEG